MVTCDNMSVSTGVAELRHECNHVGISKLAERYGLTSDDMQDLAYVVGAYNTSFAAFGNLLKEGRSVDDVCRIAELRYMINSSLLGYGAIEDADPDEYRDKWRCEHDVPYKIVARFYDAFSEGLEPEDMVVFIERLMVPYGYHMCRALNTAMRTANLYETSELDVVCDIMEEDVRIVDVDFEDMCISPDGMRKANMIKLETRPHTAVVSYFRGVLV